MSIPRLRFYNTLSRKVEDFKPIEEGKVKMYTCGPTVYHNAHIGNLRTYLFEDILKKTLQRAGYQVQHVMNITDVGHLQSDADEGQDKMAIASKREQKDPWQVAHFYEDKFHKDCKSLNIQRPTIVCRATEHIDDMIKCVSKLEASEKTYTVDGNVYFNVSKFPSYYKFGRLKRNSLNKNAKLVAGDSKTSKEPGRVETDNRKHNQSDFVLWFTHSKFPNQIMKWDSPWGTGFPGWHIECSAMAMKYLGEKIDIHCGGQDHISIHHTNEIAQSESITGSKWVNYWLHGAFLMDPNGKMSKANGGFITLSTLTDQGFEPEHFRYFCLQGHYRSQLTFSYKGLQQARNEYETLKLKVVALREEAADEKLENPLTELIANYQKAFWEELADDLNTIGALKILWKMLGDKDLTAKEKLLLLKDYDQVFSLSIEKFCVPELTQEQQDMLRLRGLLRTDGYFREADEIRKSYFEPAGIFLEDKAYAPTLFVQRKALKLNSDKKEKGQELLNLATTKDMPSYPSIFLFKNKRYPFSTLSSTFVEDHRGELQGLQNEHDKRYGLVKI